MPELTTLDELTDEPHAEIFDEPRPRAVRLRLDAGQRIPPHSHPGTNVVFHLVEGRVELTLDDETFELKPGDLARCSGDRRISPEALEPSTAVIVFAEDE